MLYLFIYFLLIWLSYYYDFYKSKKNKKFWFNAILTLFIFLSGFRYYVGSDTFDYVIGYDDYPSIFDFNIHIFSNFRYQPGWIFFMVICKTLSSSFVLPQIITALILNCSIFKVIKKYSSYPFTAILLYFSAQVFTGLNFEFMREALAVGVFIFAYDYYLEGQKNKFYLLVFLAFMFHKSAFVCFLLPFISIIQLNRRNFVIIFLVIFLFLFFSDKFLVQQFLSLVVYSDSLASITYSYATSALNNEKSFNFLIYMYGTYLILPLVFILFSLKKTGQNIMFPNILLLYFSISIISNLSADFIRLNHYFFIFLIIQLARSLNLIYSKSKFKILILFLLPIAINFTNYHYLFYDYLTESKGEETFRRYIPYKSVLNKELTEFRKTYYSNFFKTKRDFSKY